MRWTTRAALKRQLHSTRTALHLLQIKLDDLSAANAVLQDTLHTQRRQADALTAALNDLRRP